MSFAILRTRKVKAMKDLTLMSGHNDRTHETPNADPARRHLNEMLVGSRYRELTGDVRERIEAGRPGQKIRKNAVLAIDVLMSASPDYFRPDEPGKAGAFDQARMAEWAAASVAWLRERFGFDNVVRAEVHLDEATPHIHATVVPLDEHGKLNARGVIGGSRHVLRDMQTGYADALGHLGIERGRGGSRATHQEVGDFYAVITEPVAELPARKTITKKVVVKEGTFKNEYADQQFIGPVHYQELRAIAENATKQAKEARLLRGKVKDLLAENSALSKENNKLRSLAAEYRQVPAVDVLRRVYSAKAVSANVYEVYIDGKTVPVHLDGEHHRVGGPKGKKSKSAIDLVVRLEGWDDSGASASKALAKLAEKLPDAEVAQSYAQHMFSKGLEHGQAQAVKARTRQLETAQLERTVRR